MTIQEAIAELQNLVNADNIPFYYKSGIKKVIETIQMDLPTIGVSEDAISRQAVLNYPIRLDHYDKEHGNRNFVLGIESVMEYVESLPSVEPVTSGYIQHTTEIPKYTTEWASSDDCISRQAAIEALTGWQTDPTDEEIVRTLKELPPVEPPKKVVAQIKFDADEIVERIKEEYEITEKPVCEDAISRQDAIEALDHINIPTQAQREYAIEIFEDIPQVEPKIYGNEHNCIMTIFGECSYPETGCGSCEVVEKVRNALKGECPPVEPDRPKGEWIPNTNGDKCKYICSECLGEVHSLGNTVLTVELI